MLTAQPQLNNTPCFTEMARNSSTTQLAEETPARPNWDAKT